MDEDILLLVFILAIGTTVWLTIKNKKQKKQIEVLIKENAELISNNTILEFEHLKFQLEPHTLGNVVATLSAVAKNLHRGTESLGSSLNYILYKGNKAFVTVEEEINFIKKYIQLQNFLVSDIVEVEIDESNVDQQSKNYKNPCIPHLISAYLVENSYKHGDKKHNDFLKIKFTLTDKNFEMKVVNRIPKVNKKHESGGVGLKNMEKRLELLMSDKYEITRKSNEEIYSSTIKIFFD